MYKVIIPGRDPHICETDDDAADYILGTDYYKDSYPYDEDSFDEEVNEYYSSENRSDEIYIWGHTYTAAEVLRSCEDYYDDYYRRREEVIDESRDELAYEIRTNECYETYGDIRIECVEESPEEDDDGYDRDKFLEFLN